MGSRTSTRIDLVSGMQGILGKQWFRYGSYRSRPNHLPYGNYGEIPIGYFYADDKPLIRRKAYVVRLVTESKDFDLEKKIEVLFQSLDIPFRKITDEDIDKEKVYAVEWSIVTIEPDEDDSEIQGGD